MTNSINGGGNPLGTILFVDDFLEMREVVGEIINSLGYTAVLRANGKEAIDFFKAELEANRKIAGIILDLTIPGGMGGIETTREIRMLDEHVPIFLVSGYTDDPAILNPEKFGFSASVGKPFMRREFVEMLNKGLMNSYVAKVVDGIFLKPKK